jgi:hypothetical protein
MWIQDCSSTEAVDTGLFQYRSCGYWVVQVQKLGIQGRSSTVQKLGIQGRFGTEAVDTGLVHYWIFRFKADSGSGTKTVMVLGPWILTWPCIGAEDSVLVLYRRCGL